MLMTAQFLGACKPIASGLPVWPLSLRCFHSRDFVRKVKITTRSNYSLKIGNMFMEIDSHSRRIDELGQPISAYQGLIGKFGQCEIKMRYLSSMSKELRT
jgi:hypothetical protein